MNNKLYYGLLITTSVTILLSLIIYQSHKEILQYLLNMNENKVDTNRIEQLRTIESDSLLYIKIDNAPLYSESDTTSLLKGYLKVNSIFYVKGKSNVKLGYQIGKKKKIYKDYWYKISNGVDLEGWVFGYYTSKADMP